MTWRVSKKGKDAECLQQHPASSIFHEMTEGVHSQLILNLTHGHGNPMSFKAELAFVDQGF